MEFTMLPIPDVPNANGLVISREALDKAMNEYIETKVKQGNAPVLSSVPNLDNWDSIDQRDVIGQVTDIKFDEKSNSYKATMSFEPDTDAYKAIKESAVLGTNKIGSVEHVDGMFRISDDSMKIMSCSYMLDPKYDNPFKMDERNENRTES